MRRDGHGSPATDRIRCLVRCVPGLVVGARTPELGGGESRRAATGRRVSSWPDAVGPIANSHARFEGTIRSIDPVAKAIRASGTRSSSRPMVLQVVDQTQIQVDGQPSAFTDLRPGDVITASYEDRYGIKVTRSIDVRSKSR